MTLILGVLVPVAFVLGLAVESHWCGHMHQARRWESVARREHDRHELARRSVRRWASASKHWHLEYEREKRTAEGHAAMLAALGRAVSEGGSISEGKQPVSKPTMPYLYARAEAIAHPAYRAEARQLIQDAYEVGYADGESSVQADAEAKANP